MLSKSERYNPPEGKVLRDRFKLCPDCGNFNGYTEKAQFCNICGAKLIKECPQCKEPILYPTSAFCQMCGIKLTESKK
jgi:hypothetical protein